MENLKVGKITLSVYSIQKSVNSFNFQHSLQVTFFHLSSKNLFASVLLRFVSARKETMRPIGRSQKSRRPVHKRRDQGLLPIPLPKQVVGQWLRFNFWSHFSHISGNQNLETTLVADDPDLCCMICTGNRYNSSNPNPNTNAKLNILNTKTTKTIHGKKLSILSLCLLYSSLEKDTWYTNSR